MAVTTPAALEYPFSEERIRGLRVGQRVSVRGRVFTGRDRLHRYLFEGGRSPVPLRDGALYHCGPVVVGREGAWEVRAAGPTTSLRQEPYMARVIETQGVRLVIGKGGMGRATVDACRRFGCVYLHAVGGAACLLAARVEAVNGVYFAREFGETEALWDLTVRGLEAVVTIDAQGGDLHERVRRASRRMQREAMARPFTS